jgi:(E)-4-hydroxy-3-methylbut-2-enyl-diphosphate synthase
MVESAIKHIKILEELNFHDICVSLKATNLELCIEAYEIASNSFDYPLHIGLSLIHI